MFKNKIFFWKQTSLIIWVLSYVKLNNIKQIFNNKYLFSEQFQGYKLES